MKIAILFFCYNRPLVTKMTLESILEANKELDLDLIGFSDGYNQSTDFKAFSQTRDYLRKSKDLFNQLFFRSNNFGLKKNILEGISYAIKHYDAFFVIEDDILLSKHSINYGVKMLKKHEYSGEIGHINLWNYPIINSEHSYITNYMHCWGWATWSKDFNLFLSKKLDHNHLSIDNKFKISKFGSTTHYSHLYGNIKGVNETWAIFWLIHLIILGKKSIAPPFSLSKNLGFENGTNTEKIYFNQKQFPPFKPSLQIGGNKFYELKSWIYMLWITPKISLVRSYLLIIFK